MATASLSLDHINKSFTLNGTEREILRDVSFSVKKAR